MYKNQRFLKATIIWLTVILIFISGLFVSETSDATEKSSKGIEAFEQNKKLGRGVNINPRRPRFKEQYFKMIKDAGFNHIRIPIYPFRSAMDTINYTINPNFFNDIDWAIKNALDVGLLVIIDQHEYYSMAKNPMEKRNMFLSTWRQIADHYKDYPNEVLFEVLNEPNGELTSDIWNKFLDEAINTIRKSNPDRTIILGPISWYQINYLDQLVLPENDRNIIVTFHYYSPMQFTHQGASWSAETKDLSGITWTGTPEEKKAITDDFEKAKKWSEEHNRPLFLGEFGAYEKGDMDSRVRWTSFITRTCEKMGWSWAYWQFDSDFIVYNVPEEHWVEPILHALIPTN